MSEQALSKTPPTAVTPPPAAESTKGMSSFLKMMKEGSDAVPATEPKKEQKPEEKPAAAAAAAEPKAETPPAEADTENTETPPASTEKKETPKKKVIKSSKFEGAVDPIELAKAASKETGKAIGEELAAAMKREKAEPPPSAEEVQLNRAEQRQLRVLTKLEEVAPDQYKGIGTRFKKAVGEIAKLDDSRDAWMSKNNEDDAAWNEYRQRQQEQILERNKVQWDDDDFEDAKLALATDPIQSELKETKKKLEQYERNAASQDVRPKADAIAVASAQEVAKDLLGDSAKEIIGTDFKMTKENREKIIESDPVAGPIIADAMGRVASFSAAVEEVWHGTANADTEKAIAKYCFELQKNILAMPQDQRVLNGRMFATIEQYAKIKAADKGNYWTLDPDFVRDAFKDDILERAKPAIESERARFKKYQERNGTPTAKAEAPKQAAPASSAQTPKPVSPSTGAPSTPPVNSGGAKPAAQSGKFFDFLRKGSSPQS